MLMSRWAASDPTAHVAERTLTPYSAASADMPGRGLPAGKSPDAILGAASPLAPAPACAPCRPAYCPPGSVRVPMASGQGILPQQQIAQVGRILKVGNLAGDGPE